MVGRRCRAFAGPPSLLRPSLSTHLEVERDLDGDGLCGREGNRVDRLRARARALAPHARARARPTHQFVAEAVKHREAHGRRLPAPGAVRGGVLGRRGGGAGGARRRAGHARGAPPTSAASGAPCERSPAVATSQTYPQILVAIPAIGEADRGRAVQGLRAPPVDARFPVVQHDGDDLEKGWRREWMVNRKAAGHRRPPAVAVAPTGGAKKKTNTFLFQK